MTNIIFKKKKKKKAYNYGCNEIFIILFPFAVDYGGFAMVCNWSNLFEKG